jgi:hypothetical protein
MGYVVKTTVGPSVNQDGSNPDTRSGRSGELMVGDAHAKYQEAVFRGNVFLGSDLGGTAVTTQAGLSATTPALTLYNPIGSGKNLVLLSATADFTAAPAAACGLMLAYNLASAAAPTMTTAATVTNALLGNTSVGVASCARVSTLAAAPLFLRAMGGTTGAAAIGGVQIIDHIDGEIIVGPGVAVSIQATSAGAIIASITWEEVSI